MSRQPLGKTLLRNVIRHTDAHNKVRSVPVFAQRVGDIYFIFNTLILDIYLCRLKMAHKNLHCLDL